jgi:hypothetical protein
MMKTRQIFALSCVLIFAIGLLSAQGLSLNPRNWSFSATVPITDYAYNGAVVFDFPVEDGTHPTVNYFWTPQTKSISGALTAAFQIATSSSSVVFNYQFDSSNNCIDPAHVRLLMARKDFNKTNNPDYANTRWWSNPTAALLTGGSTVQLRVPLTPDQWSNINGQSGNYDATTLNGFNKMLQQPAMLGFSFGGGCFFGHGVNVSGGMAQFLVWGYSLGS